VNESCAFDFFLFHVETKPIGVTGGGGGQLPPVAAGEGVQNSFTKNIL